MPDGIIYPVESSIERSHAGAEPLALAGPTAADLAPSESASGVRGAPGSRGSRHFNRTIVGLDSGACCDFSEPKDRGQEVASR
jgi:hypothetical protein